MRARPTINVGQVMLAEMYRLGEFEWTSPKERPVVVVASQGDGLWLVAPLTTNRVGRRRHGSRTPVRPTVTNGLDRPSYVWSRRLHCVPECDFIRRLGFADHLTCAAITSTCVMDDEELRVFVTETGFVWRDIA